MLQIKNIKKTYHTGNLIQKALDDVSLNLRDNEFVAILGPSGSGKTTLLNIIGGLDQYDDGDLIINGISTKNYTDKDWDSYRNHSVGFVFQSYNLIPHQTLLQNVELALTISGISKEERRKRAIEALDAVGLKEQMHKKPSQLSGGQMQRVSLARALVNNPDILLADEPTGALDTQTSHQVMDLLKDVAKDRLVVMVTHNPELADEYATRIVKVRDGKILNDSNPLTREETVRLSDQPEHKNLGKTSMSFLTALSLSFNNLKTKKARTILTAFAGSIGIIGIALILSLSTGVNDYITSIEKETLSEYPIQIQKMTSSMMSMMISMMSDDQAPDGDYVEEFPTLNMMAGGKSSNDLKSFKSYLDSHQELLDPYVRSIEYKYSLTPQIFRYEDQDIYQVCPDPVTQAMFGSSGMVSSMLTSTSMAEMFQELPEDPNLYQSQYELKAGTWPKNANEAVLVLDSTGLMSDVLSYSLGLRSGKELDDVLKVLQSKDGGKLDVKKEHWTYDDILGRSFKVLSSSQFYEYDSKFKVWSDKKDNADFLKNAVDKGIDLKITGIASPAKGESVTMLTQGIYYTPELMDQLIKIAADSDVVKAQLKTPKINIMTGDEFGKKPKDSAFSNEDLFTVDEKAFAEAFRIDESKMNLDASAFSDMNINPADLNLSGIMDFSSLAQALPAMNAETFNQIMNGAIKPVTEETMKEIFTNVYNGYDEYSKNNPSISLNNMAQGIQAYLNSEDVKNYVSSEINSIIQSSGVQIFDPKELEDLFKSLMQGYVEFAKTQPDPTDFETNFAAYMNSGAVSAKIGAYIASIQNKLGSIQVSNEQITAILNHIASGYDAYANANGFASAESVSKGFSDYLASESGQALIASEAGKIVNTGVIEKNIQSLMSSSMESAGSALSSQMSGVINQIMTSVSSSLAGSLSTGMGNLMNGMQDAFSIDPKALAKAFKMNMDESEFSELMMSMAMAEENSYENNLRKLGYVNLSDPSEIDIYPKSFESKDEIDQIITNYNEQVKKDGKEDREISYTDMVGTMMSGVTDIINTVSYVLIAFVAVSLIVSSIMIGVITYISVLERKKEIGILRSIGASKFNISEVFNAETFITGLLSGLIGIGITLLLLIPINMVIHTLTGNNIVNAVLPPAAAIGLIVLSVILTMLGGLIPSQKASHQDPVEALRSE